METEAIQDAKLIEKFGGGRTGRRALKAHKLRKARQAFRARVRAEKFSQARESTPAGASDITVDILANPEALAGLNCGHGRPFAAMCPWCNGTNSQR